MSFNNRSFNALNISQFLGALNDNIFKLLCTFYLINKSGEANAANISSIVGIVFVIPFLLFSSVGGYFADRYKKSTVIRYAKLIEIFCVVFGLIAFALDLEILVYFSLFLKCSESAIYGPSKYGIIPEIVSVSKISKANGYIDSCVYLAIVLGSTVAPFLSLYFKQNYALSLLVCLFFSLVGYIYSRKIVTNKKEIAEVSKSKLFPGSLLVKLFSLSKEKYLFLAIIGAAYFSLIGAFVQLNLIPYGIETLLLTKEESAWLFLVGAIGIGIGSLIAGYYSGNHIELGIVPIGASLIAIGCLVLGLEPNLFGAVLASFVFGFGAGMFLVPLNSFIQWKAPEDQRGEILASSSFLSWIGVLIASLILYLLAGILSPAQNFLFLALLTFVLSSITFYFLPDFCIRFMFILITRMIYRIKSYGLENVPNKGAAILVPNHVSFVDALIISATLQRRVRYVMWDKIYEASKILKILLDFMGVIPISPGGSQQSIEASFELCKKALRDGYMVCIFAEGKLSRDSGMAEFKKGFEKIAEGMNCPIIPVYLGGVWGSIFSHYNGRSIFTLPLRVPYHASVWYGEPMPNETKSEDLKIAVSELAIRHYLDCEKDNRLKYENIKFGNIDGKQIPLIAIEDAIKAKLNIVKPILTVVANSTASPVIVYDKNQFEQDKIVHAISKIAFPTQWSVDKFEIKALESIPSKDGKYVDHQALLKDLI